MLGANGRGEWGVIIVWNTFSEGWWCSEIREWWWLDNSIKLHPKYSGVRLAKVNVIICEWSESHSAVSDSLQLHGLYTPWNSPGHNTGSG